MNDVIAGGFLLLSGVFGLWLAWPLRSGTTASMGSGYFPKMLAFALIALGAATLVNGVLRGEEELEAWYPRQLIFVLASLAFFGATIERLGLVIAVAGLVLIGCLANRDTKPLEAILLSIGMTLFTVLVFVKAIGMTAPVWPI